MATDRISNLPESLISTILSRLPTKEAVATSVLSQSWRFRWTKVSRFHFDNTGGENSDISITEAKNFEGFIDSVLRNHSGDFVDGFFLAWDTPADFSPVHLRRWVDIAIGRKVHMLDLDLGSRPDSDQLRLPCSLYTSGTLELLKLSGPFLIKPPNVVRLPKLIILQLKAVIYDSDECLPGLLAGSPVLRFMSIKRTSKSDNLVVCVISHPVLKLLFVSFRGDRGDSELRINTPAVKTFFLTDYMCKKITIEPLYSVKTVSFNVDSELGSLEWVRAMEFARSMTLYTYTLVSIDKEMELAEFESLKALDATTPESEYDAALAIAARATLPTFETVATLALIGPEFARWSSLMHLIDSCNRLESLEIGENIWTDPVRVPGCLSTTLKNITLENFDGDKEKMAMLKYLLEHGSVIETLDIDCGDIVEERRDALCNEIARVFSFA